MRVFCQIEIRLPSGGQTKVGVLLVIPVVVDVEIRLIKTEVDSVAVRIYHLPASICITGS